MVGTWDEDPSSWAEEVEVGYRHLIKQVGCCGSRQSQGSPRSHLDLGIGLT